MHLSLIRLFNKHSYHQLARRSLVACGFSLVTSLNLSSLVKAQDLMGDTFLYDPRFQLIDSNLLEGAETESSGSVFNLFPNGNLDAINTDFDFALSQQEGLESATRRFREALVADSNPHTQLETMPDNQANLWMAEIVYRKVIHRDPEDLVARLSLANLLYQQGQFEQAEAAYQEVIRLDPLSLQGHLGLADVLYQEGLFTKAEIAYRAVLDIDPEHIDTYLGLGNTIHRQGRWLVAEAVWRSALRLDAANSLVHMGLGHALYEQRRFAEAAAAYREALLLDPEDTVARSSLSKALSN